MGSFSKLKNIIEANNDFLLIGHQSPDGDCLGSLLAFGEFLKNQGKEASIACRDLAPEVFSFLPGIGSIKRDFLMGNFDAIFLLDNGDFKRTGFSDRLRELNKKKVPIVNIDHHQKNDLWKIVNVNHVNDEASSTSELVYDIIIGMNGTITPKMATLLLCGIYTDTGGFQHVNTKERVYEITSSLLCKGGKLKEISQNLSNSKPPSMLRLWGIALSRLKIDEKSGIVTSKITQEDLKETDTTEDDVSGLVNLMNTVPEAQATLLLYEGPDGRIKGSLRTEKEGVDVSKMAKEYGGGGHKRAAGFNIGGKIIEEKNRWRVKIESSI